MAEASGDADIVYPKSWAPFAVMEERTKIVEHNDQAGLKEVRAALSAEQRCSRIDAPKS